MTHVVSFFLAFQHKKKHFFFKIFFETNPPFPPPFPLETTWELGKPLGNLMGTGWKHIGNKEKNKKIYFSPLIGTYVPRGYNSSPGQPYCHQAGWKHKLPTTCPQKEKSWTPHECMLTFLNGCMKHLIPKLFVTSFSLG
jgi:hypothetical protein